MKQDEQSELLYAKQDEWTFRKLTQRKQQRPFKNEEISIHKIRKDYEKYTF